MKMQTHKFLLILMMLIITMIFSQANARTHVTESILHQVAASLEMFVDELPRMPTVYGFSYDHHGSPTPAHPTIGMFQKKWKFHRDLPATRVFAYGTSREAATVPGPTIEAIQGVPTYVTWENHLPKKHILPWDPTVPTAIPKTGGVPTVVHLHGGVQDPPNDGYAFAWFTANFKETGPFWTKPTYFYPNVQHAGNLWYHDHALGMTRANLLAGLIAAYVIRDPKLEATLNLPAGPEFDRHLFIFDRSFCKDGSLYMNSTGNYPSIHPQWQPEYFGDAMIVNGKAWPYLKVQRRKYRFRIINASNARYLRLHLSNGLTFVNVGADKSYLPSPVPTKNILLSPSEIADVIVDFSTSKADEAVLINDARYPYPDGSLADPLNRKVMKFIIASGKPKQPDRSSIPASLVKYPIATTVGAAKTRYITMYEYLSPSGEPTQLLINGKTPEDPATETPKSGSTEVWEVINLTNDSHPLHLHLASIQAIKVQKLVKLDEFKDCMRAKNDALKCNVKAHATGKVFKIPDYEKTWKFTVKIEPGCQTTIIAKFYLVHTGEPYPFDATTEPGYLYHCHILDHEDNVMVRPLKLIK
ncbi:PREDICTED: multicopper oxidase LPR1-like [Nelumbo nucifera]|uniref:Multicopper oxidase LPR1-like n=2 Tax=Nelumbo nucifera TaxID=4432 RepID=A0A1U8QAU8_NELNU|nr:PREDICTED: multicopper oxidase LPR1-like [Nelumbo nucifera]DAD36506.1 TPA_asm: hypothetical protein HUJ06_007148 [Nelumbo nucifera]